MGLFFCILYLPPNNERKHMIFIFLGLVCFTKMNDLQLHLFPCKIIGFSFFDDWSMFHYVCPTLTSSNHKLMNIWVDFMFENYELNCNKQRHTDKKNFICWCHFLWRNCLVIWYICFHVSEESPYVCHYGCTSLHSRQQCISLYIKFKFTLE